MTNIDELKSAPVWATLPRLKILEVFQERRAAAHDGRKTCTRVLLEERSDIGLATVYRVLMQFEGGPADLQRKGFPSQARRCSNSTKASTTTTGCVWTAARVEEFFDPETRNASRW